MAKVRGATLLGTLAYVRESFGEEALRKVASGVSPALREVMSEGSLVLHGWYECALLSELTREIDRVCGKGDLALAREAGRHGAFQDVNRFFKWMLRLTGPGMIFSRAASVWNNYHSAGRYVFEGAQGNRAAIRIEDWDGADPVMCKRIEGWIERALEITLGTGARPHIHEEVHLHTDGAVSPQRFCRYVAEWGS
jgi:hypothetical protein